MSPNAGFHPGKPWSLLEMLTKFAKQFILLGENISEAKFVYQQAEMFDHDDQHRKLTEEERIHVSNTFEEMLALCGELDLSVSTDVVSNARSSLPETSREYDIIVSVVYSEIRNKKFIFVPSHRERFLQPRHFMGSSTKDSKFANSRQEMADAGKCHAVGMYTAAVLHCVRAIEIGLRTVAIELDVKGDKPIDALQQETLIQKIETKIDEMKHGKIVEKRAGDKEFYSQAAMEFRHFKDGFRVQAAHARAVYEESQSLKLIEHAATFLSLLANHLNEEAP